MVALIVLLNHFDLRYNKQCDSFKDSAKVATSVEHIKKKKKKPVQYETRFAGRLNTNEAKEGR